MASYNIYVYNLPFMSIVYNIYIIFHIIYTYGKTQVLENCPFKFECPNFEDLTLKEDHGIFVWLIGSLKSGGGRQMTFLSKAL